MGICSSRLDRNSVLGMIIEIVESDLVKEVTLDLSPTMMHIVRSSFPNATMTNDRFYVQKLFSEAIDELRVSYRWMARDLENDEIQRCKEQGKLFLQQPIYDRYNLYRVSIFLNRFGIIHRY